MQSQIIRHKNENLPSASYKTMKIYPQSVIPTFSTTNTVTTFDIPGGNVMNLSRSVLFFRLPIPAQVADASNVLINSHNIYIQKLECYTANNTILCSINEYDKISKLLYPCNLDYTKRSGMDILTQSYRTTGGVVVTGDPYLLGGAGGVGIGVQCITDPSNFKIGPRGAVDWQYDNAFQMDFKSLFIDCTIAQLDKDILLNKSLYIRITWCTSEKIYPFSVADNGAKTLVAAANRTCTECYIKLAVQQNPLIVQSIKLSQNTQEEIIVPFLESASVTLNSTQQNSQFKVNSMHPASRLYKVYTGLFSDPVPAEFNWNNSSNYDVGRYQAYKILINGEVIDDVDERSGETLMNIKRMFEEHSFNSAYTVQHRVVGVVPYVFNTQKSKYSTEYDGKTLMGLDFVNGEINIAFNFTTRNAQHTHIIIATILKPLYLYHGELSTTPLV